MIPLHSAHTHTHSSVYHWWRSTMPFAIRSVSLPCHLNGSQSKNRIFMVLGEKQTRWLHISLLNHRRQLTTTTHCSLSHNITDTSGYKRRRKKSCLCMESIPNKTTMKQPWENTQYRHKQCSGNGILNCLHCAVRANSSVKWTKANNNNGG